MRRDQFHERGIVLIPVFFGRTLTNGVINSSGLDPTREENL